MGLQGVVHDDESIECAAPHAFHHLNSAAGCDDRERIEFEWQEYAALPADDSLKCSWGALPATTNLTLHFTEKKRDVHRGYLQLHRNQKYMFGFELG